MNHECRQVTRRRLCKRDTRRYEVDRGLSLGAVLMFGTFRLSLAFLVVISHLVAVEGVHHFGYYAVRAFFILSGFSMTVALNGVYNFDIRRFWTNRLLRLLPAYVLVCLATAVAIRLFPAQTAQFVPRWGADASVTSVVQNFLIIPLAFRYPDFRYIEPAWSIAVELLVYVMLFLGISRNERLAGGCFTVSIMYHLFLIAIGASFETRYFPLPSTILSFSLGALLYFWTKRGVIVPRASWAWLACIGWLINLLAADTIMPSNYAENAGYYGNTVLAFFVLASLMKLKTGPFGRRVDEILGHLSYPVFLVQWLAGFMGHLIVNPTALRGWETFAIAMPFIIVSAAFVAWMQMSLIEPVRALVREGRLKSELRYGVRQTGQET